MLIYTYVINPEMIRPLLLPVISMALVLFSPAVIIWQRIDHSVDIIKPVLDRNPLDLSSALYFEVLISVILLLGEWLRNTLGDTGVYALAGTSGIADVHAIMLSLTRMSLNGTGMDVAMTGIVIASAVNKLVKAGMTVWLGSARMWRLVLVPMVIYLASGLLVALNW